MVKAFCDNQVDLRQQGAFYPKLLLNDYMRMLT